MLYVFLVIGFDFQPFALWIYGVQFQFYAAHGFRARANKFAQRGVVFLFLLFVFFGMIGLVGITIFRLGNSAGHSTAVGLLVGQQKFRHVQHIVGGQSFIQSRHGQIKNLVRFEPLFQFRRNFQIIDE